MCVCVRCVGVCVSVCLRCVGVHVCVCVFLFAMYMHMVKHGIINLDGKLLNLNLF